MLTFTLVRRSVIILLAVGFTTACSTGHHYPPAPADRVATQVLAPIATWNPVAGTQNKAGSAASGMLQERNGEISTTQTFEVWNSSGAPLSDDIRRRHEVQDTYQHRYNRYPRYNQRRYHY
jgi:hypothetical protein